MSCDVLGYTVYPAQLWSSFVQLLGVFVQCIAINIVALSNVTLRWALKYGNSKLLRGLNSIIMKTSSPLSTCSKLNPSRNALRIVVRSGSSMIITEKLVELIKLN